MIDSINSSSKHIYTGGGGYASGPYISPTESIPMHGVVRYTNQQFQAYNGGGWLNIPSSHVPIGMTADAEQALDWAIAKMKEEQHIAELAKENATVADALASVKEAQEKLAVVVALVE